MHLSRSLLKTFWTVEFMVLSWCSTLLSTLKQWQQHWGSPVTSTWFVAILLRRWKHWLVQPGERKHSETPSRQSHCFSCNLVNMLLYHKRLINFTIFDHLYLCVSQLCEVLDWYQSERKLIKAVAPITEPVRQAVVMWMQEGVSCKFDVVFFTIGIKAREIKGTNLLLMPEIVTK